MGFLTAFLFVGPWKQPSNLDVYTFPLLKTGWSAVCCTWWNLHSSIPIVLLCKNPRQVKHCCLDVKNCWHRHFLFWSIRKRQRCHLSVPPGESVLCPWGATVRSSQSLATGTAVPSCIKHWSSGTDRSSLDTDCLSFPTPTAGSEIFCYHHKNGHCSPPFLPSFLSSSSLCPAFPLLWTRGQVLISLQMQLRYHLLTYQCFPWPKTSFSHMHSYLSCLPYRERAIKHCRLSNLWQSVGFLRAKTSKLIYHFSTWDILCSKTLIHST